MQTQKMLRAAIMDIEKITAKDYDGKNVKCYIIRKESDFQNLRKDNQNKKIELHGVIKCIDLQRRKIVWILIKQLPDTDVHKHLSTDYFICAIIT